MLTTIKRFFISTLFLTVFFSAYAQINSYSSTVSSECSVDWINKKFSSVLSLTSSNGIIMPAERAGSEVLIAEKMAYLVKDPLLSLFVDSANTLGDVVLQNK